MAFGARLADALVRGAGDVAVGPWRAVKAAIGLSLERVEGARQAQAAVGCVGQALAVIGASVGARDFGKRGRVAKVPARADARGELGTGVSVVGVELEAGEGLAVGDASGRARAGDNPCDITITD